VVCVESREAKQLAREEFGMLASKMKTIVLIAVLGILVSGCISPEERARGEEIRAEAEIIVQSYLREKYDMRSVQIDSIRLDLSTPFMFMLGAAQHFTGEGLATVTYNDRTFYVLFTPNGASDDFQFEEIKQDFVMFVQEHFSFNSHIIPQNLQINYNENRRRTQAFWGMNEFYDGNMGNFIAQLATADSSLNTFTLLFGVERGSKDTVVSQLIEEATDLQRMMRGRGHITLAFYNSDEFAGGEVVNYIENYEHFSLRLLSEVNINSQGPRGEIKPHDSTIKIFDYTSFSPALVHRIDERYAELDYMDVCGYSVNGEEFSRASLFFFSDTFSDFFNEGTEATILTDMFSYGVLFGDDSYLFPEHRLVRFNIARRFPEEVSANREFVVLERRSGEINEVPFLIQGDFLYFRCMRARDYAIGVR
jgi:hypothetical protein